MLYVQLRGRHDPTAVSIVSANYTVLSKETLKGRGSYPLHIMSLMLVHQN